MKKQHYILIFILSVLLISCNTYGEKLEFNKTEVYYTNKVKKEEAEKLGKYLVSSKFADGRAKSVQLTKNEESGNYVFRMVTNEKAANSKTYETVFKLVATQISDSVFNSAPVDFDVCDNTFNTIKTIKFESK